MSGISANVHTEELTGSIYTQISGDHCLNCVREACNERQRQRGVSTGSRESYRKRTRISKRANSQAFVLRLWLDLPRCL